MRGDLHDEFAGAVREHRIYLNEMLAELVERGAPVSVLEIRFILEAADGRCAYLEQLLVHLEGQRTPLSRYLRRLVLRARGLTKPRIGTLRQYERRPLMVPAGYPGISPPLSPPTISVVTPSFQQGGFLERTLYSVLSQDYPALEYVVQDGASNDETLDVLRRFDPMLTRWGSPLGRTVAGEAEVDLRSSGIDGFMDDPEPEEEGLWR